MPLCRCRCSNTEPSGSLTSLLLNKLHKLPQCSLSASTIIKEKPRLLRRLTIGRCKGLFHSIVHIYIFYFNIQESACLKQQICLCSLICPGHAASSSCPPHTELHWESVHVLGDAPVHNVPKQNPASLQNTTQNHDPIHCHTHSPPSAPW